MKSRDYEKTDKEKEKLKLIGRRIFSRRRRLGLSQENLSDLAGVSLANLSTIEKGEKTNPTILTLIRLCEQLGIPVKDLLDGI